jgi:hypothetical protein
MKISDLIDNKTITDVSMAELINLSGIEGSEDSSSKINLFDLFDVYACGYSDFSADFSDVPDFINIANEYFTALDPSTFNITSSSSPLLTEAGSKYGFYSVHISMGAIIWGYMIQKGHSDLNFDYGSELTSPKFSGGVYTTGYTSPLRGEITVNKHDDLPGVKLADNTSSNSQFYIDKNSYINNVSWNIICNSEDKYESLWMQKNTINYIEDFSEKLYSISSKRDMDHPSDDDKVGLLFIPKKTNGLFTRKYYGEILNSFEVNVNDAMDWFMELFPNTIHKFSIDECKNKAAILMVDEIAKNADTIFV